MQTSDIRSTIHQIRKDASSQQYTNVSLRTKYYSFFEENPRVFEAAIDVTFPLTYLELMLAELDKLNNKTVDMDSADKNIYGHLREIYVDPLISVDTAISTPNAVAATDVDAVTVVVDVDVVPEDAVIVDAVLVNVDVDVVTVDVVDVVPAEDMLPMLPMPPMPPMHDMPADISEIPAMPEISEISDIQM